MAGEGTPLQSATAAQDDAPANGLGSTDVTGHRATGDRATVPEPPSVRASDADRHAVVAQLSRATGDGRITLEEFADAAGAAYAAVTLAELESLYRSFGLAEAPPLASTLPPPPSTLPAPSSSLPPPPIPSADGVTVPAAGGVGAPAPVQAQAGTENVIAIMSGNDRKGRWRMRRRTRVFAFWGGAHLDLRDAVIESEVVEVEAWAVMGGVKITVPEGIPVELTGCVIMGGNTCRVANVPALPGAPVVKVRAGGMWGGVEVRSRPSRRPDPSGAVGGSLAAMTTALAAAAATVDGVLATSATTNGSAVRSPRADVDHPRHRDRDRGADGGNRARSRSRRPAVPPPGSSAQSGDLLTVVCTDIVGSTRLSVGLGDQRWHALLSAHNALVRDLLGHYGGTEVKTSGDGFLLTFTSARAALQFSMALQDAVADERSSSADAPIELRIGVHAGEVERDGRDVIGRNVTIACRLCDAAAPREVLASAVVADLADSASDLAFGPVREHSLAGIDQPLLARPAARA